MTTVQNRIKARLLAYASDCYARGWEHQARAVANMCDYVLWAAELQPDGLTTWAQWQSRTWAPFHSAHAATCAWALAILDVVAREESALLFIPRRSSKAHDESDRLKVSFVSKCSHVFDIRARRCVECGVTEEEVRRVEADS